MKNLNDFWRFKNEKISFLKTLERDDFSKKHIPLGFNRYLSIYYDTSAASKDH